MPTHTPHTISLQTARGRVASATLFGDESNAREAIIMNYGFPGDSRNYDIAAQLADLGYLVCIPHPAGVEASEGLFTFREAGNSFKALFDHCNSRWQVIGVVSYCYSALWVLKELVDGNHSVKLLSLAPILDWSTARRNIDELSEGGFKGFLEQARHGVRQGFYGARCDPDFLMSEYAELEQEMRLKNILARPYQPFFNFLYGDGDSIIIQAEIEDARDYLQSMGTESKTICIPGAGHFFTMRRRILLEELKGWASTSGTCMSA